MAWLKDDLQHVWHPYTQALTAPLPLPIVRAEGVYLYTEDGRKILDGVASWWVNLHGHSHPRLTRALQTQAQKLSQVIFANFTHEPAATLARELSQRTGLPKVFFSDNGSTSVEVALKMAYQYWRNRGELQRTLFVAFENGYHGDTFGAMSVSNVATFAREFKDILFKAEIVPLNAEAFARFLEEHGSRVAGVIIEPMVQGVGGMLIYPAALLRQIRQIAFKHHVPFIADEIFTAFGRTGKFLACEHADVQPDLLCLSKGITGGMLPLGTTLATQSIYDAFLSEDRGKTLFHGHSYTGNALSCAVAVENLQIFDDERCLERVAQIEAIFKERLGQLQGYRTRCIGALAVIELPGNEGYLDQRGPQLAAAALEQGLLLRPLGNVLYFLPPYVITPSQIHWAFDVIEKVLLDSVQK
jgi:adenosylmethionine---8-amino-7-oxononanoate aminotransferase